METAACNGSTSEGEKDKDLDLEVKASGEEEKGRHKEEAMPGEKQRRKKKERRKQQKKRDKNLRSRPRKRMKKMIDEDEGSDASMPSLVTMSELTSETGCDDEENGIINRYILGNNQETFVNPFILDVSFSPTSDEDEVEYVGPWGTLDTRLLPIPPPPDTPCPYYGP